MNNYGANPPLAVHNFSKQWWGIVAEQGIVIKIGYLCLSFIETSNYFISRRVCPLVKGVGLVIQAINWAVITEE